MASIMDLNPGPHVRLRQRLPVYHFRVYQLSFIITQLTTLFRSLMMVNKQMRVHNEFLVSLKCLFKIEFVKLV